ncbi:MAG: CpsD/CapB family tyrosine-protein kinase [Proteobacteria bacterium]|nr:CpsD/CapB family tyrosine-protein kinase [Pseudomonadota bacterium]MBU1584865.1 CpsD/CapB family tyrosine-protein kinase [Pseudomonadota bacterium]MBU2456106.1 CpsD/CapB family tyrosine-protein kinase [Pseudomonadota bacterium]MBU2628761.1 CpsD/CapB family tyrosine-protein kinase [Pseudomonadota bacterium]
MLKLFKKQTEKDTLLSQFPVKSGYAESFRTMRTNLQFTSMDKDLKCICVTSATEMEGKTNTAANLAYTIAQTGQRVLMVDCDLRKPGLTKRFGQEKTPGLTELISKKLGAIITEGAIADVRLNDLIKLNKLQKRTGILSISDDINQVDISFCNGSLADIYWKNRPEKQKLASSLISNNLLTKEQAQTAIGHQKKSVQKLGTILTTMGMITRAELKKHLSVHIVEAFKTAVSMFDGKFTFTSLPVSKIDTTIEHNVNFDKLFREFLDDENQFPFLTKTIESMIVKTDMENLYLLPSGKIPPNPSEMICSERMLFVLEHVTHAFDFVIIDTPPVLPASDAMMIAPNTDGILMVVMANKVNKKYIKDAISQLETGKTKILGLILNRVDVTKERYYRYYRKYYTAYYGKPEGE